MDSHPRTTLSCHRQREDGWTPDIREAFIAGLIEHGSVRAAAKDVDRHVTTAYRLRRRDPAFAAAWDAARRMAYARLRDEAIERALDRPSQEVREDGEWIGTMPDRSDRLLMALLTHLKHDPPPHARAPRDVDMVEGRRSDVVAAWLVALVPAGGSLRQSIADPVALA